MDDNEKVCCQEFDPRPWDKKVITWNGKKFIKARVFTIFYMPINFGQVILRILKNAREQKVRLQQICLSDHTSKWNMDIYVAVDKEVSGYENTKMTGRFLSKVYEGDFKETGNWCADFEKFAKTKNAQIKKMYMFYTTCPACAKKYGRNYVVIIGKI
ncbi:MAG: hydrolase [Patescibacteria group bacterium]